ncbi:MAG: LCP family protein [bacterium]
MPPIQKKEPIYANKHEPLFEQTQSSIKVSEKSPIMNFPKNPELYIPREQTIVAEKHEQKFQTRQLAKKIILTTLVILLMSAIVFAAFFLWKTYATTKKMNDTGKETSLTQDVKTILAPIIPTENKYLLAGEESGRVNILLLGAAGEHKPGGNLTDTVMVMSIDTKNKKVAMLSLPRDLYVSIGSSNSFTKINSLYKISLNAGKGTDLIKESVEKITGLTINYYVTVDFDAFEKIIDNIGGINVMAERDIYDPTYPGPNYSYETFSLKKGFQKLDGKTALKYVRERHDDPEGDFGRAKRQQQVIQAVKSKLFSMQTMFNVIAISNVLDTLGDNIKTDMSFVDLEKFIGLSKTVDTQNINNVVVDAWKPESLLKVSHVMLGNDRAFILVPRVGNYSEIKDVALNIFDQAELKKRHEEIINENASIAIVNNSGDKELPNKVKKLLSEKLDIKDIKTIPSSFTNIQSKTTINSNADNEKIFTLDELIKKLPATLSQDSTASTDSTEDIIINLGSDLIETYKYEEDSIEDFNKAQDSQENIDFTKNN